MKRPFRFELLRGRCDGFAIIAVLIVMVVLGLIGGAALSLSTGDARVTQLFSRSAEVDAAATAGLEHGAAQFEGVGIGGFPLSASINGYDYIVNIWADTFDYNGDSVRDTVCLAEDGTFNDNEDCGATERIVYVLESTATRGSYVAVQRMRVARLSLIPAVPHGALSSNSSIQLNGDIIVDGRNHTISGALVDSTDTSYNKICEENKPAVVLTDMADTTDVRKNSDVTLRGNERFEPTRYVEKDSTIVYVTPEQILGLEEESLGRIIQDADTYIVPDSIVGLIYVDGDYGSKALDGTNKINGTGMLVVHNPLYDPREHDPADPRYDSSKVGNPAYAPANLGNINGGTFHGIIIADKIDKIDGNVEVIGAVISLSRVDFTKVGAGTADIKYSCEAIQAASNSLLPAIRLSWKAE
jgi:type II secretory pathway pseudopilin PulG